MTRRGKTAVEEEVPPPQRRGGRASGLWWWTLLPAVAGATLSASALAAASALSLPPVAATLLTATVIGAAGVAAAQLARRRLQRLRELTLIDPITQLSNRRCLHLRLREELRRARDRNASLAVAIIDLDQLKSINDQFGHLAGDAALCAVARAIRRSCRACDLAVRFGGDEFVVLMADTTARQALALAERIREELRRYPLAGGGAPTVSIGIADTSIISSYRGDPLLRAADRALYAAKQRGRDQVLIATAHPEVTDRRFSVDEEPVQLARASIR